MLAQLRLAWWRETLGQPAQAWPTGDVLLASLASWNGRHGALTSLVDAWEALTAPAPLGDDALEGFAQGRGAACAALAEFVGSPRDTDAAMRLGRIWALEDLSMRLGREQERSAAGKLAALEPAGLPRTKRAVRSLRVLAGLARRRRIGGSDEAAASPGAVMEAIKLGLLGL